MPGHPQPHIVIATQRPPPRGPRCTLPMTVDYLVSAVAATYYIVCVFAGGDPRSRGFIPSPKSGFCLGLVIGDLGSALPWLVNFRRIAHTHGLVLSRNTYAKLSFPRFRPADSENLRRIRRIFDNVPPHRTILPTTHAKTDLTK